MMGPPLSSNYRMYDLYTKFVRIFGICKQISCHPVKKQDTTFKYDKLIAPSLLHVCNDKLQVTSKQGGISSF
ncbi:hypothetical protein B5F34_00820 [Mediterranea sp. An20]|nr:hypothetical protein B5F34_00820 [Mediterranea sp. An20]